MGINNKLADCMALPQAMGKMMAATKTMASKGLMHWTNHQI